MPNPEKLISFIIFGLFIFSPALHIWQGDTASNGYTLYAVWFMLIGFCALIHRAIYNQQHRD